MTPAEKTIEQINGMIEAGIIDNAQAADMIHGAGLLAIYTSQYPKECVKLQKANHKYIAKAVADHAMTKEDAGPLGEFAGYPVGVQ